MPNWKVRRGEAVSWRVVGAQLEGLRADGVYGYRIYKVKGGYILRKPKKRRK